MTTPPTTLDFSSVLAYELTITIPITLFILTLIYSLVTSRKIQDVNKPTSGTRLEKLELGTLVVVLLFTLLQCILTTWRSIKQNPGIELSLTSSGSIDAPKGGVYGTHVQTLLTLLPLLNLYATRLLFIAYFFTPIIYTHLNSKYKLGLYFVSTFWAAAGVCSCLLVLLSCHPLYVGDGGHVMPHGQGGCWSGIEFEAGAIVGVVGVVGGMLVAGFSLLLLLRVRVLRAREEGAGMEVSVGLFVLLGCFSVAMGTGSLGLSILMLGWNDVVGSEAEEKMRGDVLIGVQVLMRVEVMMGVFAYGFRFGRRGGKKVEKVWKKLKRVSQRDPVVAVEEGRSIEVDTGRCFDYVKGELVEYSESFEVGALRKEIGEIEVMAPRRNTIGG